MTWLQDFEARLQSLVASHGAIQTAQDPSQTAIDVIRGMNSLYAGGFQKHDISGGGSGGGPSIGGALHRTLGGANWLLDKAARPLYAVDAAFLQAQKNARTNQKGYWSNPLLDIPHALKPLGELLAHPEDTAKALGRGISGQEKTTGSDILRQGLSNPQDHQTATALLGFGLDVAGDPLNVLGGPAFRAVGKGTKVGIRAGKDLMKPGNKIAADVLAEGTSKVPTDSKSAADFLSTLDKTPSANVDAPFTIAEPPPSFGTREFHVSPEGATTARRVLALPGLGTKVVTGRAQLASLTEAMQRVPSLAYSPKSKIAPIYREVSQQVPVETPKPAAIPKVVKSTGLPSSAARVQAMYQHLLTHPETSRLSIKIGGREQSVSVAQLQNLARKSDSQAQVVKQALVNRARELAGMDKTQLAEQFPTGLKVRFAGRTGQVIPESGIDVEALQHLLETGNVPKTALLHGTTQKGTSAAEIAVARHAIHDVSDLSNLSLRRLTGEHVSVADYLNELGVKVNPVKTNVEALVASLSKKAPATTPASKSVFKFKKEPVPTTAEIKKVVGLTKDERAQWVKDHGFLDPKDAQALLRVRSVSGFQKKVAELLAKKSDSGFANIEALTQAVGEGRVNKPDLEELLNLTGAKTIAGVRQRMNQIVKQLADAEKSMFGGADQILTPQSMAESAAQRAAAKVVPAEQIVGNVVNHGMDPMLTSEKEVLDATQAELLKESLTHGVAKNFLDPKDRAKYGFETNRGVKRTMGEYGKGYARHLKSWNSGAQLNAFRSLVSKRVAGHVASTIERSGAKITGSAGVFARGSVMYDFVMPILRAQEKILKNEGIPPILGTGDTGPLLSTLDILDSLPKHFVVGTLFDATPHGRQVLFTQFNEIALELLNHGMGKIDEPALREQIAHILTNPIKQYDKTKPPYYSNFAKAIHATAKKNPQAAVDSLDNAVNTFVDALPDIMQRYNSNLATYGLKFGENVSKISNETITRVSQMFVDPHYSPGDIVQMSTKIDRLAQSISEQFGIKDPWARQAGSQTAQVKLAESLPPEVQAEAKAAHQYSMAEMGNIGQALKDQRIAAVGRQQSMSDTTAVEKILDAENIRDLGQRIEASYSYRIFRGFAPHLGNQDLHPLLIQNVNATQFFATGANRIMNSLKKSFDDETIKAAFHEIQQGTIPVDQNVLAAHDALKPFVDTIFDGNADTNFFLRNGVTMRDVNAKLRKYNIHDKFAMENSQSWRQFDPKDPIDLLGKFHAATQAALSERLVGNRISEKFGSVAPQPGFVRVKGGKRITHLIDTNLYYPKEVAEQFHVFDRALVEFNTPNSSNAFLRKFDAFFHSFKAGLTIYRPGHHIRNVVGDTWFSYIAGVNNPVVYKDALKVMAVNKGRYADFDALRALQELGVQPGAVGEGVINSRIGGKAVSLSHQDIYRLAVQHGVITDYHTIEDIAHTPGLHEFLNKYSPARGKIHNAAVNLSEAREHYVRLAHFVDVLKKGNYKDINAAGEEAGAVVRKWHPDGSDLGNMEKATARRLFLFYSWMRKAIPLVVESAVRHPGKFMAYPKAYYAIAQSMGVDLNGFGDPYPPDQLFPEWIRDNIEGPIIGNAGSYYAAHPGVPAADIMNQFLGTPRGAGQSLLSSITPAVRVPIEAISGTSWGTGAPIKDKTDYIDQNVPGFNTIASLTNRSVSGLGQPVRSVATGNEKGGLDGLAFLNWLTGGGVQDISRPNYQRSAQLEQKYRGR